MTTYRTKRLVPTDTKQNVRRSQKPLLFPHLSRPGTILVTSYGSTQIWKDDAFSQRRSATGNFGYRGGVYASIWGRISLVQHVAVLAHKLSLVGKAFYGR
ncbi:hypothetical protein CSPAE12_02485 [Colletotrichum incanum]|nr:hypothetical protein CSPAE12_02485 [Colletotrichum incanum]